MPLSLQDRNPELVARVDDAYERARSAAGEVAQELGGATLNAVLAADVAEAKEAGTLATGGVEAITDPEIRRIFGQSFAAHEQLFRRANLNIPSPDELAEAGIDISQLAVKFAEERQAGHEPELVLAPVMPLNWWKSIYTSLQDDVQGNRVKDGGLYIYDTVRDNWDSLNTVPQNTPATLIDAASKGHYQDSGNYQWTLRVIPGTNKPTEVNVRHDDQNYPNKPTVGEYLTLQATRLQDPNSEPIDNGTYTWLDGTMNNGSRAPCGRWYPDDGRVFLFDGVVDFSVDYLGVRSPVW